MALIHIPSEAVKVYPTALRGGKDGDGQSTIVDPESRLATEFNITNPVNRLTIDGSFVISYDNSYLEFSLHGYYFRIKVSEVTSKISGNNIYAIIKLANLAKDSQTYTLNSLVPTEGTDYTNLDNSSRQFIGLGFSASAEFDGVNTFGIKILEKKNNKWAVPTASLLSIKSSSIMIDTDKTDSAIALDKIIYKDINSNINIKADEISGHVSGNVTGNLAGNATTSTDSSYATKIGTSTSHPAIGSGVKPVYVDSTGKIVVSGSSVGSNSATVTQTIYMDKGEFKGGWKVTRSTKAPTSEDKGNPGDLWIQYV